MFFYKPEELKDIGEPGKPICLVPTSQIFPTLSAVVLTSDAVITVEITIAFKHVTKAQEFDLIYRNLPPDLLKNRPKRYHVVITDEDINPYSWQEQNQTQIPDGTLVYCTVINVGNRAWTLPVTEEHVEALEKARVSMDWLYAI